MAGSFSPQQIAAIRALLAGIDSCVTGAESMPAVAAVCENGIGADGGAPTEGTPMCTVHLYEDKDRNTWRVRVRDTLTKKKTDHSYPTEAEARAAMPELERKYRRPVGVSITKALDAYREHLEIRGNRPGNPNPPRTIEVTMDRLRKLFEPAGKIVTGELTPVKVKALWEARAAGEAVDTNLNTLSQARTFVAWLLQKRGSSRARCSTGSKFWGSAGRASPNSMKTSPGVFWSSRSRMGRQVIQVLSLQRARCCWECGQATSPIALSATSTRAGRSFTSRKPRPAPVSAR